VNEATWWRHLKGDSSRFVLVDDEPGVVWRALVSLFARPADSPAVVRARLAARERGAAAAILGEQNALGYWGSPAGYGARWSGTAWRVVALAALGADPEDRRVERGAETLLEQIGPVRGGFATAHRRPPAPCFTAEVCAALVRLGFRHHPRVREAVAWLVDRSGGAAAWSCPDLAHLHDGVCPVAAAAALRLVGEHAAQERVALGPLAQRAADFLLSRGLYLGGDSPRGWRQLSHPCLARTDLLDGLAALARLDWPAGPEILHALLAVLAAQDDLGRWCQQHKAAFGEEVGQPSRWVTLKALIAVAAYGDALGAGGGSASTL
jgi:hypothetical protein